MLENTDQQFWTHQNADLGSQWIEVVANHAPSGQLLSLENWPPRGLASSILAGSYQVARSLEVYSAIFQGLRNHALEKQVTMFYGRHIILSMLVAGITISRDDR